MTTLGNLFFDPLNSGIASAGASAGSGHDKERAVQRRGTQTPAELKALRAASLAQVRKDLERMIRQRSR